MLLLGAVKKVLPSLFLMCSGASNKMHQTNYNFNVPDIWPSLEIPSIWRQGLQHINGGPTGLACTSADAYGIEAIERARSQSQIVAFASQAQEGSQKC